MARKLLKARVLGELEKVSVDPPPSETECTLNIEAQQRSDGEARSLDVQQVRTQENLPLEGPEQSHLTAASTSESKGMVSWQPENEGACGRQQERETVIKLNPMRKDAPLVDLVLRSFPYRSSLVQHETSHTGEKLYKCSDCEKSFTSNSSLSVHKKSHTREKMYKCLVCEKSFFFRSRLVEHEISHTGEKPYLCSYCGMSFSTKSRLLIHKRVHTGGKPMSM